MNEATKDEPLPQPSGIQLTCTNEFDRNRCILCQQCDKKGNKPACKGSESGISSLKRAADARDDEIVKKRIHLLETEKKPLFYHNSNACFKKYTHKKYIDPLQAAKEAESTSQVQPTDDIKKEANNVMLRRSSTSPREKPLAKAREETNSRNLKCVFCGSVRVWIKSSQTHEYFKYRLSGAERVQIFLDATRYFKDEVYCRTSDLSSANLVTAADLFYHDLCYKKYSAKYFSAINAGTNNRERNQSTNKKNELFQLALKDIDPRIKMGVGFTISEIRDYMHSLSEGDETYIYNRDVKKFLIEHYGDTIQFAPNPQQNKPELVFLSSITAAEVASKVKNMNVLREAGESLRNAMKNVDFGLDDCFCDSESLKRSWENTSIPEEWLMFYSSLFKIRRMSMVREQMAFTGESFVDSQNEDDHHPEYEDLDDNNDSGDDFDAENSDSPDDDDNCVDDDDNDTDHDDDADRAKVPPRKKYVSKRSINKLSTQLSCLFQITYYRFTHGRRKTPLQIMMADSIYGKTRSKGIVTDLNTVGVTVSYPEMKRQRRLLCQYTLTCNEPNEAPVPSHFSKGWTMGALDNENFADQSSISGTNVKNYTAQVLYQDASESPKSKPPVSSTNLNKSQVCSKKTLSCQELKPVFKPVIRPSLPTSFKTIEETDLNRYDTNLATQESESAEFLITLLRCGLPNASVLGSIPPWAGIHALITKLQAPLMRVGFLPVLPHPVTQYSTVRKSLTNFQSVRKQLGQDMMPVFCDEGVFHIVVDIMLNEPDFFSDLFPMLGTFHMTKVLLRCAGRYLTGSGVDDALIEGDVFGKKVLLSVLSGGHYVRSLQGMFIVSESLYSFAWQAFWETRGQDDQLIQTLQDLQKLLLSKKREECVSKFELVLRFTRELRKEFNDFIQECEAKSELCRYFGVFQEIFRVIKNLVASDRDGNWHLHVEAVRSSMSIFRGFDAINYLRYASFYLENIQVLQHTHPSLYERFVGGYFVVRDRKNAFFSAVAGDMKLEQSINRFSKGQGGYVCVGASGDVSAVAEFELLFHEVLSITNLVNQVMGCKVMGHLETSIQHSLRGRKGMLFDKNVSRFFDVVKEKGNPYSNIGNIQPPLHNIMTKTVVDEQTKLRILHVLENGREDYLIFRNERYVEKKQKLTAKISKSKLPGFKLSDDIRNSSSNSHENVTNKDIACAQRKMDIASLRGMSKAEIFTHDLLDSSTLFEVNSTTKTNKSQLVTEIEDNLLSIKSGTFNVSSPLQTHILVDCMSNVRQYGGFSTCRNFGHAISNILDSVKRVAEHENIHILFDSYIELSIKGSERTRRKGEVEGIELATIDESVTIPAQLEKFWPNSTNKENLQLLVRKLALQKFETVILSSMVVDDEIVTSVRKDGEETYTVGELNSWEEEADDRVIMHTKWSIRMGAKRVVVLSNDSDTLILLLRYMKEYLQDGLTELWLQYGRSEYRRMIPLHVWYTELGDDWCHVLIKVHVLTGNDFLSTVGTKLAAIKSKPLQFLSNFGESPIMTEPDMALAEEYLVHVWYGVRGKTAARTFDELRLEVHMKVNVVPLDKLPPTSSIIREHLKRVFFVIRRALTLLDPNRVIINAVNNGWFIQDDKLLPSKGLKRLPDELMAVCGCGGKCRGRCKCSTAGQICVPYCHKGKESKCINNN